MIEEYRSDSEQLVAFLLEDLARDLAPMGRLSLLEKVSDEVIEYYEGLPAPLSSEASFNRGRAFGLVADVALEKGRLRTAFEAAARAEAIHEALVAGDQGNTHWLNALVQSKMRMGEVMGHSGEPGAATEYLESSRDLAEYLVEAEPGNPLFLEALGEAHYGLGLNKVFANPEESIEDFSKAISIFHDLRLTRSPLMLMVQIFGTSPFEPLC